VTATQTRTYSLGEFHSFEGGGRRFIYLVPAGAIFEMDSAVEAVIGLLPKVRRSTTNSPANSRRAALLMPTRMS